MEGVDGGGAMEVRGDEGEEIGSPGAGGRQGELPRPSLTKCTCSGGMLIIFFHASTQTHDCIPIHT